MSSSHHTFETKSGLFRFSPSRPAIAGLLGWLGFTFLCSFIFMHLQHNASPAYDEGYASKAEPAAPGLLGYFSGLKFLSLQQPNSHSTISPHSNFREGSILANFAGTALSGLHPFRRERNTVVPGAYPRLEMLEYQFADLVRSFPHLARIYQIGESTTWRQPIWAIRLSDNPDLDEDEPAILFTGIHHAREPLGAFIGKAIMEELLANYGKSARHTRLVDSLEIWLVPIVNPDGYKYIMEQQLTFPWWRKNLRDNNGDGLFDPLIDGVDLNRNYDYNWEEGGEGNPGSWFYRGSTAFSENEIQALRDLALRENFLIGVSYHSYGESILYPWGNFHRVPDQELIVDIAQRCANQIGRVSGSGYYNVLPLNGRVGQSSIWMYAELSAVDFIIETGEEYFPSPEDIPRIVHGNVQGALYLMDRALRSGVSGHVRDRYTAKPLSAEIHVQGFDASYVKSRRTNTTSGRFDRLLFPGSYTLEIRSPGYQSEIIEGVQIHQEQSTWLEITLARQVASVPSSTN
jgi:hypothetical protein